MYFILKQIDFNAIESFDGAESALLLLLLSLPLLPYSTLCLFCIVLCAAVYCGLMYGDDDNDAD